MYYLTQEVIIKFFEISNLSTPDHNNFTFGFSQNFNVFNKIYILDYDDQEVNKKSIFSKSQFTWIHLLKLYISLVEIVFEIDIFKKVRFILKPFNREGFLRNPHLKLLQRLKQIGKKNCFKILVYLSLLQ